MGWRDFHFTDRLGARTQSYRGFHDWMGAELDMTTRGLAGSLSSVVNDLGYNRELHESSTATQKNYINSRFGKVWGSSSIGQYGKGYMHPVMKKGQNEAVWRVAGKVEDAMSGWDKYINERAEDGGFFTNARKRVWDFFKGKENTRNPRKKT